MWPVPKSAGRRLAVKPRIVSGAVQRSVGLVVGERNALVRAGRGEAYDVPIRTGAARHALAKFQENAWCILIWIGYGQRLVCFQIAHVR